MSSIEDFFVIVAIRIIECDICGISECGDEVMNIEWRRFGRDMIIFFFGGWLICRIIGIILEVMDVFLDKVRQIYSYF
mgnify:FL=1